MTLFLTSSPTGPLDGSFPVYGVDERNSFGKELRSRWTEPCRALLIAADPDAFSGNDEMCAYFDGALKRAGLPLTGLCLLDHRYALTPEQLQAFPVLLLAGGHTPTQNRWFREIGLRGCLMGWDGILIGISAGTMNCADPVYNEPEEPGEAVDPAFPRFIPGLGLTRTQIIPHYQQVKELLHDGLTFGEMNLPCSYGHSFLALCDGSWLLRENGRETVFGEAYRIADGRIEPFCGQGETRELRTGVIFR